MNTEHSIKRDESFTVKVGSPVIVFPETCRSAWICRPKDVRSFFGCVTKLIVPLENYNEQKDTYCVVEGYIPSYNNNVKTVEVVVHINDLQVPIGYTTGIRCYKNEANLYDFDINQTYGQIKSFLYNKVQVNLVNRTLVVDLPLINLYPYPSYD